MSPMTKEDVPPKWVTRMLRDTAKYRGLFAAIHRRAYPPDGEPAVIKFSQNLLGKQRRVVCKECNNTWMSDFENSFAKPVISPLIFTDSQLRLTTHD